jgi:hypothetical protein
MAIGMRSGHIDPRKQARGAFLGLADAVETIAPDHALCKYWQKVCRFISKD